MEEGPVVAVGAGGAQPEQVVREGGQELLVPVSPIKHLLQELPLVISGLPGIQEDLGMGVGGDPAFIERGHQLDAEGNQLLVFHLMFIWVIEASLASPT